jgi:hypothetical protein
MPLPMAKFPNKFQINKKHRTGFVSLLPISQPNEGISHSGDDRIRLRGIPRTLCNGSGHLPSTIPGRQIEAAFIDWLCRAMLYLRSRVTPRKHAIFSSALIGSK